MIFVILLQDFRQVLRDFPLVILGYHFRRPLVLLDWLE